MRSLMLLLRRLGKHAPGRAPLPVTLGIAVVLLSGVACSPTPNDSVLNLWDTGPITLDPAISGDTGSHAYVKELYSGLVRLDSNLEVEPDIAKSCDISEDGTVYTFHLREDVTFHNGDPVTASDFKYSWERACTPSTGSKTALTYLGDIVGAAEMLAGEADSLAGVTVVDDYTLQVRIDAPRYYFLEKLTYPTAFVVDKASVSTGPDWWKKPNGTGPFELQSWQQDSLLVLARNPDYYGTPALVDAVYFHLLAGTPMSLYEQGSIDVVGVSTDYMDAVTDPSNPFSRQLISSPELSLYYIGFDVTKPPFDDPLVRQAFCHAVDRDRIVRVLFKDSVTRAGGILPQGMPGYDPTLDPYTFAPELARSLLAQSSYGSAEALPPITITLSGYANNVTPYIAAAILDWKENLGVEVSVRQLDPDIFLYELPAEHDQMYAMGWIADYPDPYDFLGTLFGTGQPINASNYSNPEFDSLLDKAAAEPDESARLELYRQAERMLVDDAPCLPLLYGTNYVLVRPYVMGYDPGPLGVADLAAVSVERP